MQITLNEMSALARALVDADENVLRADAALKDAKERARMLREETIPSAMQELGLQLLVLETGENLKIQQDVYASIPTDGKGIAYAWLENHGFGGLIKTCVEVSYGKGEREQAISLFNELQDRGLTAKCEQSVHAQTLKAFLKEQLAKGSDIPLEIFGARPVWTTKITKK